MNTYNQLNFTSFPTPERGLERIAVVAKILGANPTNPNSAKILEIGCSTGMHLNFLADKYPQSQFVGIDTSADQIAKAVQISQNLNLKNIQFSATSIEQYIPTDSFDYIICHGVFSWVSANVQKQILSFSAKNLSPNGIALISYNALPDWNFRAVIKKLLPFAEDPDLSAAEKIESTKKTLNMFLENKTDDFSPYGLLLQKEIKKVLEQSDAYIYHEILNPLSSGNYLSDFITQAHLVDLCYLGDARPSRMRFNKIDPKQYLNFAKQDLYVEKVGFEQLQDISQPIPLRTSLLVSSSLEFAQVVSLEHLDNFHYSSSIRVINPNLNLNDNSLENFELANGRSYETSDSLLKAILVGLSTTWPCSLSYAQLNTIIFDQLKKQPEQLKLKASLFNFFEQGIIEIHLDALPVSSKIQAQPKVSAYVHEQLKQNNWATNQRNEYLFFDPMEIEIIKLLDGQHSSAQIFEEIFKKVDGKVALSTEQIKADLSQKIQETLEKLRVGGFLRSAHF